MFARFHPSLLPTRFQKIALALMSVLVVLTFLGTNLQAMLWRSSQWLVSAVLPAVVVDLTNQERSDWAEKPLKRSTLLDEAARLKAEDMAKYEYFAHYSPSGVTPWHWFDAVGYSYVHAGENLAVHFTDSAEVVEAWMDSPTHRDNIVSSNFTEIGVGTAKGSYNGQKTVYVVQLFGTPTTVKQPSTPAKTKTITAEKKKKSVTVTIPNVLPTTTTEPSSTSDLSKVEETKHELTVEASEVAVETVATTSTTTVTSPVTTTSAPITNTNNEILAEENTVATATAPANIENATPAVIKSTGMAIATQPFRLLQLIYGFLTTTVVLLLLFSIVMEARRVHYIQVAYGLFLMVGMGGLWLIHSWLNAGVVVA